MCICLCGGVDLFSVSFGAFLFCCFVAGLFLAGFGLFVSRFPALSSCSFLRVFFLLLAALFVFFLFLCWFGLTLGLYLCPLRLVCLFAVCFSALLRDCVFWGFLFVASTGCCVVPLGLSWGFVGLFLLWFFMYFFVFGTLFCLVGVFIGRSASVALFTLSLPGWLVLCYFASPLVARE